MATVAEPTKTGLSVLLAELAAIVGEANLLHRRDELLVYECDGFVIEKSVPDAVVFPTTTEQVAAAVKACHRHRVPFVARGAGTSLAGGTLAVGGGVLICLTRMKGVVEISPRDRCVTVESGVVNVWLSRALAGTGLHFAPDPSSQVACTIGGNAATNSGGPHTIKYGVTVNHVLGLELVMPDGEVVTVGGPSEDNPGYDLTGLIVGNEGTFGIITKVTLALTRDPEAGRTFLCVYRTVEEAAQSISQIIAAGIVPAALEMLDRPMIRAVEEAFHFGFPTDAGAILICEIDGLEAGQDRDEEAIRRLVAEGGGVIERSFRWTTRKEPEYLAIWKCRKSAFGAIGRLSPSFCTQDGVVPRTKLPYILRRIAEIAEKHGIRIANVFHAGDGNIHPILLFDDRYPEQLQHVLEASHEIIDECIALGGTATGEHGIGVEKIAFMPKMFTADDLEMMKRVRQVFNPDDLCSPRKLFPDDSPPIERATPGRRYAT
jgi:glycolate oxidase